ncbi:MAG: lysine biosynthesis protein LysX [Candidatus Nezhaarchaeales archaeon]
MKLAMVIDRIRVEEKMLYQAARARGLNLSMVDSKDLSFNLIGQSLPEELKEVDVFIDRCVSHFRALHVSAILEAKGKTVINPYACAAICGNKLLTTLTLNRAGIPTPKTVVAFTREAALRAIEEYGYPVILKPVVGSWGRLVSLVKDRETAEAILEHREHLFPLYQVFYIQEYVKRPPRDIRCFVVGDQVVAAIYRYAPSWDWRTNTARGGKALNCPVTDEIRELGLRAAKAVGGVFLGVDMMEGPEGLLVHEVNSVVEFRNSVPATGVDIPGLAVEYIAKTAKS